MSSAFSITASANEFKLKPGESARVIFSVTNNRRATLTTIGQMASRQNSSLGLVSIVGRSEQEISPRATVQFVAKITIPKETDATGAHRFEFEAYSVDNPDEDFVVGPAIRLEIDASSKPIVKKPAKAPKPTPIIQSKLSWWAFAASVQWVISGFFFVFLAINFRLASDMFFTRSVQPGRDTIEWPAFCFSILLLLFLGFKYLTSFQFCLRNSVANRSDSSWNITRVAWAFAVFLVTTIILLFNLQLIGLVLGCLFCLAAIQFRDWNQYFTVPEKSANSNLMSNTAFVVSIISLLISAFAFWFGVWFFVVPLIGFGIPNSNGERFLHPVAGDGYRFFWVYVTTLLPILICLLIRKFANYRRLYWWVVLDWLIFGIMLAAILARAWAIKT